MRLRMPSYYPAFRCAAGDCPDTCCRDWAVVLDRETAAFYETVPGPLGGLLRAAMDQVDGEPCLSLRDGLCPALDARGLCRVQLELGEERLCSSCALHPRFAEEYGALREWSLSMGCPEAARLLLSDRAPVTFLEETTDEPVGGCNDLDPRLFLSLLSARRAAIAAAQDRSAPWERRLNRLLAFAAALQKTLDRHRPGRLDEITARFAAGRLRPLPADPVPARELLARLAALEPINDRWSALLAGAAKAPRDGYACFAAETAELDYAYEHLLVYYLFRYFLRAAVDRRLLPRVQLAAVAVLCIRELEFVRWREAGVLTAEDRIDRIHSFGREVEHSEDNLERLLGWFEADPLFAPARLCRRA